MAYLKIVILFRNFFVVWKWQSQLILSVKGFDASLALSVSYIVVSK